MPSETGLSIDDIDREIEKIQAHLSATLSTEESVQVLARQAVLLIAKADAYMRRGAPDAALKTAREAVSLIDGLRGSAARTDPVVASQLEERWFEAHSAVGLAQVEGRDLVAARKTLRFLLAQLREAKNNNMPTVHVVKLEKALDDESQERLRTFYAEAAEDEAERKVLWHDWDETHLILDTLVEEIAERMAFASALVGRVSHPERFQEFLAERLRGSLLRTRHRPVDEISHVEFEIRQRAEERGRRLQAIVWESSEMWPANRLQFKNGTACSDEALAVHRDALTVLGLPHPNNRSAYAYPHWQFGQHRQCFLSIFQELKQLPAWAIWHFFHQGLAYLFDLSPLDFLRMADDEANSPRFTQLVEEHGGVEETLLAAARDYVSGLD